MEDPEGNEVSHRGGGGNSLHYTANKRSLYRTHEQLSKLNKNAQTFWHDTAKRTHLVSEDTDRNKNMNHVMSVIIGHYKKTN